MGKILSIDQIENEAKMLSSYDGGAILPYTGEDDDLIEFSGSIQNFAGENIMDRQFSFQVVNAATATRTAVIWPGYLKGNSTLAPGQLADGAFNDAAGSSGLTGTSNEQKTIAELFAYLDKVPTRLRAIQVRSTVENQMTQNFTVYAKSPFTADTTRVVRPKDFQDQNVYQTKILQFLIDAQLDFETLIKYPFVASSTTTLTWYFGASLNIAAGLRKKADRANTLIAAYAGGAPGVVHKTIQNRASNLLGR